MSTLKALAVTSAQLATEFRNGTVPTLDVADLAKDPEFGRAIDLHPLTAVVAEARRQFDGKPSESDPWLGPRVHATLRLTRREAADKRIWQYLTVVEFPDYVRWRWPQLEPDTPVPLDRFIGIDNTNSFARLWWTAELTRNGSDYEPAVEAFRISQFFVWQGLNLVHHRAAALAAVRFLTEFQGTGATNPQTRAMAKVVNIALRTLSLDALAASPPTDVEAVREWIAEPIDETTMMGELPSGPDEAPVAEGDIAAVRKVLDDLADRIRLSTVKAGRPGAISPA